MLPAGIQGAIPIALTPAGEQGSTTSDERSRTCVWLEKVVDKKEAKKQMVLATPMVMTNVFYYLIPLVSVMFAGRLGQLQLASSTLANSWANVSGYAFMLGLSGGLETLCGQGYGAQMYEMMGVYLQASSIISILFSIVISVMWWFTEPILKLLHQEADISEEAAIYMRFLIPGLFAYGIIQNILRFLQTQSVAVPLVVCSLVPLLLNVGLNYLLVHCTTLGYRGAPLATSITLWISFIMLLIYVSCAKKFEFTWRGLSKKSFGHVISNLKLAMPSAAMVCLEYAAFEILVLLAGLMPDPKITTAVLAMCANTESAAYNFTYGLSAAASTRASNELGAQRPNPAKRAMGVALKLSMLLGAIVLVFLGSGHNSWARFFSDNSSIIKAFASMTPFLCISIFLDSIQGILSGVSRGCGWQNFAMFINLGSFYLIGMPIACLLSFKLHLYNKGLWIGLICGLAVQTCCLFLVTHLRNWNKIKLSTHES